MTRCATRWSVVGPLDQRQTRLGIVARDRDLRFGPGKCVCFVATVAHGQGAAGSVKSRSLETEVVESETVDSGADAVRRRMSARIAFITDLA